ncbi:hypothetical protein ACFXG4_17660 [Nocardia sp. NPDC059246]|uniref:hypothetical protein n=1 Tax=unclassified Nocardia TaxID=2637762 RepID=UPI0036B3309F
MRRERASVAEPWGLVGRGRGLIKDTAMNFEVDGAGLPISHLAAAALGLGVVGVSDVTVIVSDEFADTVTELTGNPDRGIDLRTGLVSRTIVTSTGPTIVLNAPDWAVPAHPSWNGSSPTREAESCSNNAASASRPLNAWPGQAAGSGSCGSSPVSPSRNIGSSGHWSTSDTPKSKAPKQSTSRR